LLKTINLQMYSKWS